MPPPFKINNLNKMEKETFLKNLLQLWNEYGEHGVDNKNSDNSNYTFDGFMNYLKSRYDSDGKEIKD